MVLPMGRSEFFYSILCSSAILKACTLQQPKHPGVIMLFQPIYSLPLHIGFYFKVFHPQNISLLPKVVTEAHA